MRQVSRHTLWNTATALASTATLTSPTISVRRTLGVAAINCILAGAGISVSIAMEVSYDDVNWYTPYATDGSSLGDIIAVGSEITASKWIQFDPCLAPYLRIKVTGSGTNGADTTLQAYAITQDAL